MATTTTGSSANAVRLYYEERGNGPSTLCVHGGGGTALAWADAVERLARLGRVIAYDRRGCGRSERPEPYERTSVAEHADDAAALLAAVAAAPAVVIGRSYGARWRPSSRCAIPTACGRSSCWRRTRRASSRPRRPHGWTGSANGCGGWRPGPASRRSPRRWWARWRGRTPGARSRTRSGGRSPATDRRSSRSSQASGGFRRTPAALATLEQPTLLVTAADSPPELREPSRALADALPNARLALVGGGHLIDPASPEVITFLEQVLAAGG